MFSNSEFCLRGEKLLKPKIASRLRCSYTTNNVPFLFLQPIKMEEAYLKPRIVIYHDVISDQEIETIKRLAQPKVLRLKTCNADESFSCYLLHNLIVSACNC